MPPTDTGEGPGSGTVPSGAGGDFDPDRKACRATVVRTGIAAGFDFRGPANAVCREAPGLPLRSGIPVCHRIACRAGQERCPPPRTPKRGSCAVVPAEVSARVTDFVTRGTETDTMTCALPATRSARPPAPPPRAGASRRSLRPSPGRPLHPRRHARPLDLRLRRARTRQLPEDTRRTAPHSDRQRRPRPGRTACVFRRPAPQ